MAPGGQPAEHLVEVRLSPPSLGVHSIQPVDDQDLQKRAPCLVRSSAPRRPGRLKRASRTPFTNRGESLPP